MTTSRRARVRGAIIAVAALILVATPAGATDGHCAPSPNGWMNCLIESDPNDLLGTRTPLVLIHGWNAASTPAVPGPEIWTNFLAYYQVSPALRGAYKPYLFAYYSNDVAVPELAAALREVIDLASLDDPTNFGMKSMTVVAHSMGGLIARSFMQEQTLTVGAFAGQPGGGRVAKLITLGTPHHGSPLANGPARDARAGSTWGPTLALFDSLFFAETGPEAFEVNRSDLRWDDDDALLDHAPFASESNPWLVGLNAPTSYDARVVAYASTLTPALFCADDRFCWGSLILRDAFGLASDGVVPVSSALLLDSLGQPRFVARQVAGYTHDQLATGRGDTRIFDQLRLDLTGMSVTLPSVSVAATSPTARESHLRQGRFTVTRTGSTDGALAVLYTVGGTAIPGTDYVALSGQATIPAGSTSATIAVVPINDAYLESEETVVVTLAPSASYAVGVASKATVTIVSDER